MTWKTSTWGALQYVDEDDTSYFCRAAICKSVGPSYRFNFWRSEDRCIGVSAPTGITPTIFCRLTSKDLRWVAEYAANRFPRIRYELQVPEAGLLGIAVCRDFYAAFVHGLLLKPEKDSASGRFQKRRPPIKRQMIDELVATLAPVYEVFR